MFKQKYNLKLIQWSKGKFEQKFVWLKKKKLAYACFSLDGTEFNYCIEGDDKRNYCATKVDEDNVVTEAEECLRSVCPLK